MVGVPLSVDNRPSREDDPARRRPDITQARRILGWEPQISCADGLQRTVEYLRNASSPMN
jgi:nucleoside-diphosphate-sugar epimerase